jgi:hypothetical protein
MASDIHHHADKIIPDANVPLHSDPHAVPPLNSDHWVHNNLVSDFSNGAPATMTTDSRSSAPKDFGVSAEIADTLSTILAQLSTINKRLELQGEAIAHYDQLFEGGNGLAAATPSAAKHAPPTGPDNTSSGSGGGGGNGNGDDGLRHPSSPNNRDFGDDLLNSFHHTKLNFSRYDGEVDPLPWLNHCESYFRGTHTMVVEQVWLASLHMDGVMAEWYYALECDYGVLPWTRFTELVNL